MKRTNKYELSYFEQGDRTSSVNEMQRWETLDAQLYSLFSVLGNGVLSGWTLLPSSGLSVVVSEGNGHVDFVAVASEDNVAIPSLLPSTRNYIYALLTQTSYWDQSVTFQAFATENTNGQGLFLGYVDTDLTDVTAVNQDGRQQLGFITLIQELISSHRHIGGTGNPPPVNLSSEVQGIINQKNLPDLDASLIQTGTIDVNRLPSIDHITKLINQGTLTHAQLDAFVEALNIENPTLMGETSTIDLLQLILALKHVYPDIDEFLINELAYIPGVSPDEYVDWDNTTATVDILPWSEGGQHTITGTPSLGRNAYTKTWDTEAEFESGTQENVLIDGDNVCLNTQEIIKVVDELSDITNWNVTTTDISSVQATLALDPTTFVVPPASGKLNIDNKQVEVALVVQNNFDAQDWTLYNYIVFYIKTENVDHGDVFFYLNDASAGTQNSYIKILDRNAPTINIDTLQNGWQEVRIDISAYTRANINTIGFYISTQDGWDTSKGFDFNIDNVFLTDGNKFKTDGYLRVVYGSDFLYEWWRVRWDALIPTDSQSTGLELKYRTRVGNSLVDLQQAIWSAYSSTSGSDILLPAPGLYRYVEIEMYFKASDDFTRSACLKKLYLDFYASDVDNSFNYDSQDDWESGDIFNIDLLSIPDSMTIAKTGEVNDIFYGTQSNTVQLDDDLTELYRITGTTLPKSTYQAMNDIQPSFGLLTGVSRGNQGNIWVADIDNDRVVEVDKSGALVKAFYGSFLTVPIDSYGIEDFGPGRNVYSSGTSDVTTTTSTSTLAIGATLDVLQNIYNSEEGVLYVVFDASLENIYDSNTSLNMDRIYIKIGTQRFYLNDSTIELLGVDQFRYSDWIDFKNSTSDYGNFINQFNFTSHVLKITLQGADRVLLNSMVNQAAPSVVIDTPYEQQRVTSSTITANFLLYNFVLGSGVGENAIRVTLDGTDVQDIYSTSIIYTGLASGVHTVRAQLLNGDGTLNTNVEAIAEGTFVVTAISFSQPFISITNPRPNQIYSSSPVVVDFDVENFAVLPTEQHLRYIVDSEAPVDHYSADSISLEDLSAGEHSVRIYMVDRAGVDLGYTYGSVTVEFNVGLNSNAVPILYVDSGAISDINYNLDPSNVRTTSYIRKYMDVANVYFSNIYSPIDIQVIPVETGRVNPSGLPTILVSKLRSQSWLNGLSRGERMDRFRARLGESVISEAQAAAPAGTIYQDGYIQYQITSSSGVNTDAFWTPAYYVDGELATSITKTQLDESGFATVAEYAENLQQDQANKANVVVSDSSLYVYNGGVKQEVGNVFGVEVVPVTDLLLQAFLEEQQTETAEYMYQTKYLDGHSIVQLDGTGNTIFSNNAAVFALTKTDAKDIFGSGQKLGDSEILAGDAYNKRAIITYTDLITQKPKIEWQYDSDRFVSDFHIILQDNVAIDIYDDRISDSDVFIRQGSLVIWENKSASPVSVYSGTTTAALFELDPDLNLYGSVFKSETLQPGERYSYKFVSVGEVDWFVYPGILTGKVTVTRNRISSRDQYVVLESDGLNSPFSSRVVKLNSYGDVLWSFGSGYLVKPRDARPLLSGGVVIST